MRKLLFIIKNYKIYKIWKKRKKGKIIIDYVQRCCFYFQCRIPEIGNVYEFQLKSGRIGLYKLIKHIYCSDPADMTELASYQFLGIKGKKAFTDMSFEEYANFMGI